VADYLAEDDAHALALAREAVRHLNRTRPATVALQSPEDPAYDPDEILGVVPADLRTPYDIREVIARIVDGSRLDEFKARFGETLVTGFAHVMGMPVGIVANNGVLFSEAAVKGAHFVELCSQRGIPLVFLQNITGFMVGRKYENEGIARHGAKMVTAVATTGAQDHHAGRRLLRRGQLRHGGPRLFAPVPLDMAQQPHLGHGGRTGGRRAGHRARDGIERAGGTWSPEEEAAFKPHGRDVRPPVHPLYASARLWDDGIIDPRRPARCWRCRSRPRSTPPSSPRASACSGCRAAP
jgi:3-methylcrotonyl-CoA carboxylase beta subunit